MPAVRAVSDVKANFALIELLEVIAKDEEHQKVDERAPHATCSECDQAGVWFCENDDAYFCAAHKESEHQAKSRANHRLVLAAGRVEPAPKCSLHKSKDLDLFCQQCAVLACDTCWHFGAHKEHPKQVLPVEEVMTAQRDALRQRAEDIRTDASPEMDSEAQKLVQLLTGTYMHQYMNACPCMYAPSFMNTSASTGKRLTPLCVLLYVRVCRLPAVC